MQEGIFWSLDLNIGSLSLKIYTQDKTVLLNWAIVLNFNVFEVFA